MFEDASAFVVARGVDLGVRESVCVLGCFVVLSRDFVVIVVWRCLRSFFFCVLIVLGVCRCLVLVF